MVDKYNIYFISCNQNGQHMIKEEPTQSIQLQHINSQPESAKLQPPPEPEQPRPCLWCVVSWVLFLVATVIYGGIWAISALLVKTQTSQYYRSSYPVSPYIEVNNQISYCDFNVNNKIESSATFYSQTELTDAKTVALTLIFSWIMWKLPLAMFMLQLIFDTLNSRIVKYVTWAVALSLMLAADILLTIFLPTIYQDYMFFAFTALLTVIIAVINNRPFYLNSFLSAFIPYFYVAVLYFFYSYLIPSIFNLMVKNINPGFEYLIIYGYPVLDAILYGCLLLINSSVRMTYAKPFLAFIHFYLLGYLCGITMLASVTEVEFYYLVGYVLFRNFFVNWVMWKWEGVVNNPPCLPGWGIIYYLSYVSNFLPVIGLGPLVLSKSFQSQQFSQSCLLIYYYPDSQYPYTTTTPSLVSADGTPNFNYQFQGFIFWPAALIIWGISTFTQKYPRRKPTLFDLFYNLVGIYMFYLGISGGLQLLTLRQVNLF